MLTKTIHGNQDFNRTLVKSENSTPLAQKICDYVLGELEKIADAICAAFTSIQRFLESDKNDIVDVIEELIEQDRLNDAFTLSEVVIKRSPQDKELLQKYGFKPGEWQQIKKQKATIKDPFFNTDILFTPFEKEAIEILVNATSSTEKMTSAQKEVLCKFYKYIYNNKKFNETTSLLKDKVDKNKKLWIQLIDRLRTYSFKTGYVHSMLEIQKNLHANIQKLQNNHDAELAKEDKLSLHDLKIIESFENSHEFLETIFWEKLYLDDPLLQNLCNSTADIRIDHIEINRTFAKSKKIKTGAVILHDINRYIAYHYNNKLNIRNDTQLELKLQKDLCGHHFNHAAIAGENKRGITSIHEIQEFYNCKSFSLFNLSIARIFKWDFSKLLTEKGKELILASVYPNSEKEMIRFVKDQFKTILNGQLKKTDFSKLQNSPLRRIGSVLSFHSKTWEGLKSYFKSSTHPFLNIDFEKSQIFCSEFVGKILATTFYKLNEEFNLLINPGSNVPIEFIINPIPKYENFAGLHIDRLYELIKPYTKEIESPFLRKIVKI
ncbi:MAG: hypothetical protein L0207_07330 [Chlamydiae bacterium]|nr:hypothetical protein [Chlamydiota bacterium]